MLMLAFLVLTSPKAANASADRSQLLHKYQKQFYHADGYIKAIGHAASHTIYSPNAQIRHKWKGALRYLVHIRSNAQHHIYMLRRPAVTSVSTIRYSQDYWINRQIQVAEIIAHSSSSDPWPNCPDPVFNGASSWQDTVNCENGGNWYDSPGYYRCGLQFDPNWELRYGRLCP